MSMRIIFPRSLSRSNFIQFCLLLTFAALPISDSSAQDVETPSSGVLLGSFGKLKCSRDPQGMLKVKSTKTDKNVSQKRARLIQQKNRALMRNLIRSLNKIAPQKGLTPQEQQQTTFDQLPEKQQLKYLKLENRLLKLQMTVNQVENDTLIADLVTEIQRLKQELKDLKQQNKKTNKSISQCKGCDDGEVENVDRSFGTYNSSFVPRTRAKACSCFTKTIAASFKFEQKNYSGDPSRCTAVSLVQWNSEDDVSASNWSISYFIGPNEKVDTPMPPFNDNLVYTAEEGVTATFSAESGSHQHLVAVGGADAPDHLIADCSQQLENQMSGLSNPTVEITICPQS